MPGWLLVDLLVASLFVALAVFVAMRRPRAPLWPSLLWFQLFALLFVIGDAVTYVAANLAWKQLGVAILYSGGLPLSVTTWILALRYAEAVGRPFTWVSRGWVRLSVAFAVAAWALMITNPWHGLYLTPVLGSRNQYGALWWVIAALSYVWVLGALGLITTLAVRARDRFQRGSACLMLAATLVTLAGHWSYVLWPSPPRVDPTVLGLCLTSLLFLAGIYRTRLFLLFPVALREIIRHERDGVMLLDPEGRILHANPAARRFLALTRGAENVAALPLLSSRLSAASEATDALRSRLAAVLEGEPAPAEGHVFALGPDGAQWLRLEATPIPDRRGATAALSLRLEDVTAPLRAREALRESEERYRSLVEHSPLGVVACDREGRLVAANARFVKLIGAPSLEFARGLDVLAFAPMREAGISALFERCFERGEPLSAEVSYRPEPGGVAIEARFHLDVVRNVAGELVGAQALVEDITEERRAERELRRLQAQLQAARRSDGPLEAGGGTAPELRNLLGLVLVNAEIASSNLADTALVRAALRHVHRAALQAVGLVADLRARLRRAPAALRPLELSALVEEIAQLLHALVSEPTQLDVQLARGLPAVDGDATQLRQLLLGLVANAPDMLDDDVATLQISTGSRHVAAGELACAATGAGCAGAMVYLRVAALRRPALREPAHAGGRAQAPSAPAPRLLAAAEDVVRTHGGALLVEVSADGPVWTVLLPATDPLRG